MSPYDWRQFKEDAKDTGFIAVILWFVLGGIAFVPIIWGVVLPMFLGYLIFDIVLNVFVKGRKIPLSEKSNQYKPKGWVFGVFLIGIITATVLSAILSDLTVYALTNPGSTLSLSDRILWVVLTNSLVTFLLWLDFDSKVWKAG